MTVDPLKDVFVIHTEHDTRDHWRSRGPIIMETYAGHADLPKTIKQAKRMGKYGKVTICKVVPVGSIEECEKLIEKEI